VQVSQAPVRAARLASGGQRANRITAAPSRQWKARCSGSGQASTACPAVPGIFGPRSSLRIEGLQDCRRYIGRWSGFHGDNRVMMHVTPTTPASRFLKPTDAACQGRLDPIFRIRA
jgi:hypothetical protein